jgi:putative transposase
MMLVKNMLVKWLDDEAEADYTDRILWIDPARDYVYTFDMDHKSALPVRRGYSEIVEAINRAQALIVYRDNPYLLQSDEQFTEKQRQRRDENWTLIEPIVNAEQNAVFVAQKRGELVEAASKRTGRAKRLIYQYLRLYWREGQMKNALIPRFDRAGIRRDQEVKPEAAKRGRPRSWGEHAGVNVDAVTRKLLEKGYQRFYLSGQCKTLTEAHHRTLTTFFRIGESVDEDGVIHPILPPKAELPTLRQFKYHSHQRRNPAAVLAAREGESRANASYSPKLGSAPLMAFGPGAWFLIDSTPADCLLVSSLNRSHVLGKPTLYFVKDLFSMLIVGVEVSLEEASWVAEVLAIQNALTDKVAFCQAHEITISPEEWPCHHAPEFLLGDRGENESVQASNLVTVLGIQVSNTPPYRPDLKGPVELDFHLANQYAIHRLPGGGPPPKNRGDKDTRGLPSMTLYEFRRSVISYILFYNKSHVLKDYPFDEFMIANQVKPVPIHLWNWGIENRSGHLRSIDPDVAYRSLLPRAQATVTRQGIEFKGVRYFSQYAADQQWYLKAGTSTGRKRRRVTVAYDPRTTNYVFLCLKGQTMERCSLLERDQGYTNREWVEVDAQKAFEAAQQVELENDQFQALTELHARLDHISDPARQEAEAAREREGISKRAAGKNMHENRRRERELERRKGTQKDVEIQAAELAQQEATRVADQLPETYRHSYIPQADYSALIDELMDEEADHA